MQRRVVIPALSLLLVAGCGGGGDHAAPSSVTIGGTVTGLVGKLVLQDNAGDNLSVTANGAFTFATPLNQGATYAVTILTQPPGPTCVVSNGSGASAVAVTSVSVTCTVDPATVFLPISAAALSGQTDPADAGLFVVSSKSTADPPIQITPESVFSFGLQTPYTVSAQGTASAGNPYALMYTTLNSSGGDHLWSLNLSGASTLVPAQLSNLTIPYHTFYIGSGFYAPEQFCQSLVAPKNLTDPSSVFLILALPTDATSLCGGSPAGFKWVLIHSSDSATTSPVTLPALSASVVGPILPLYRPDGTLAGLVAIDTSKNLNFYPDETLANPQLLLANVAYFTVQQEPKAGPVSATSADPTYSFLLVTSANSVSAPSAVYRVDYSGSISANLDYFQGSSDGLVADSGNLYFTDVIGPTAGPYHESVGRIPGDGGPMQSLGTTLPQPSNRLPTLAGLSGSNLVFWGSTPQLQWYVETLPTGPPGPFTPIASSAGVPNVALVGGDVFVAWTDVNLNSPTFDEKFSTQILDSAGNVLQANLPSSYFASQGAPVLQVRDITYSNGSPMGGQLYVLDLSQPSAPVPVALKTATGTPFEIPSSVVGLVGFSAVTPTIGVSDVGVSEQGGAHGTGFVYDLAKGVVVPVSMPNSTFYFLTAPTPEP
jgi:hypothetical protein